MKSPGTKRGGARPGAGKPPFAPTPADRNTVMAMVAAGIPMDRIARCIGTDGIDEKTMRKHFRLELERGKDWVHGLAVGKLAQAVNNGEAWAICFLLKTKYGYRETQRNELVTPAGETINVNLSDRELVAARIAGIRQRLAAEPGPTH